MAQVFGTGPCHIFLEFGGNTSGNGALGARIGPLYYGTTREGPDITENFSHYPVMNDLTGPGISFDDGFAGREDIITLVMTRWLQAVENAIENYPRQAINAALAAAGSMPMNMLGTMIVSENAAFAIYIISSGALRPGNVAGGMPIGRVYYACEAIGPHKPIRGLKENMTVRTFKAKNVVTVNGGNALANPGRLDLFSEDPANLARALAVPIS